jgi:hypothetical protein
VRESAEIYAVVDNLLDETPPPGSFWMVQASNPYDPVGRYFRVGVRLRY